VNEQRASVVILTHVLHRMYDFFTLFPVESFTTEQEMGRAFLQWLSQQDRNVTEIPHP
jgi:hypothetical protein